MSGSVRIVLAVVFAAALIIVAVKLILPLIVLYTGGVGVDVPAPTRFAKTFPRLTIWLFVIGSPLLFLLLLATEVWLLKAIRLH